MNKRNIIREIKFRAWDGKEMWNPCEAGEPFQGFCTIPNLMQYTGLKDSKEIEIYEGDIVKSGSKETVVIEWNHDGFYPCLIHNKKREIIGNVYENPKLLNDE